MKTLSLALSFFTTLALCAQNEKSAYVVTLKGDTVKGTAKVNPKKELEVFEKVVFKDAAGVQKNYRPEKIKAYGIEGDHYRVMINDGEPRFYKVLASGDIQFFETGVEAIRMNEVVISREYYYTEKEKLVRVKENKFRKQMTERMEDNVALVESYPEDKEFYLEKALELINSYNAWKAGNPQDAD